MIAVDAARNGRIHVEGLYAVCEHLHDLFSEIVEFGIEFAVGADEFGQSVSTTVTAEFFHQVAGVGCEEHRRRVRLERQEWKGAIWASALLGCGGWVELGDLFSDVGVLHSESEEETKTNTFVGGIKAVSNFVVQPVHVADYLGLGVLFFFQDRSR